MGEHEVTESANEITQGQCAQSTMRSPHESIIFRRTMGYGVHVSALRCKMITTDPPFREFRITRNPLLSRSTDRRANTCRWTLVLHARDARAKRNPCCKDRRNNIRRFHQYLLHSHRTLLYIAIP